MIAKVYLWLIVLVLFVSCTELERGIPVKDDETPPPPITNISVTNIPGGAEIDYQLPESDNLLYVMAEYSLDGENVLTKKSSFYNNNIRLEGFPDTLGYKINLYAVSRGGKKSASSEVVINPLTPPVISTFNTITVNPTFGGIKINFENQSEADLRFIVLAQDSLGELYTAETYYTKRQSGDFSVRGFPAEERIFGVYAMDRWDNHSDTLLNRLIPYFEQELDKGKFEPLNLPTDTYINHVSGNIRDLWDGLWGLYIPIFHTKPNTGIPQWFTIDLGVSCRLSRFKFYHRRASGNGTRPDGQYSAGDPQMFEVYGSNNPAPDGSWGNWDLLGHFESIKPSGGQGWTEEDIQFACYDGEDFEFDEVESYRYLRFKVLKTWGGVSYIYIEELTFWGEVSEQTDED